MCVFVKMYLSCSPAFAPGASEWKQLQDAATEKLKNSVAVAELMDRVRSFLEMEKVFTLWHSISKSV